MAEVIDIYTKKRVRSSNWDEEEKRLLRQLVLERIDVIENKDTSTNTNMKKKSAWQEVLSCFNSLNNKKRDLKELTTQWRNTKGKVKSRDSEYKRAKLMTGGGPPPPSPPPEDFAIIQAIPNEFVVDSNKFDSDSIHINSIDQSLISGSPRFKIQDEPLTPLPASINQITETEEIPKDKGQQDEKEVLCPTPKAISNKYKMNKCKPKKKKIYSEDYEQELFLIAKKTKEREYERAEEIHKKKIAILDMEYEYWKKKLNNSID